MVEEIIKRAIEDVTVLEKKDIMLQIPRPEFGDFSFQCFSLAKLDNENARNVAKDLAIKLKNRLKSKGIEVKAIGGYINFFVNKEEFSKQVITRILREKNKYGSNNEGKNKKVTIEFPSPNTNKPLHLGHLRNMSIGEGVSRLLETQGFKAIRINLNNDRGIHICKSMLAYKKWGKNKKPGKKQKSDHFVGDFYVLFNKKSRENRGLEKEAKEMLKKWESKDKATRALWKKMNVWALNGFEETYKLFGLKKFDRTYFESNTYEQGKKMVMEGLKKGKVYKTKNGAAAINLDKSGLGEKVLIRADGTSVYVTQDLYLALLKNKEFKPIRNIYVVGSEQNYHFNVLFKVLEILGYKNNFYHLSYGMVYLPEGKMKSREGTVIDADNFIKEIQEMSKKELNKRYKLKKRELEKRSLAITLAAIKYFLLRIEPEKDMLFKKEEAISFEGNSGPYLQYSYVRANSILKKVKVKSKKEKADFNNLHEKEYILVKKLSLLPKIVRQASRNFKPSVIANYGYDIAKTFNDFYECCPVLKAKEKGRRIALVKATKQVLENCLNLLGIPIVKEM